MADLYGSGKWTSRAQGWSHTLKNMKETGGEAENPQVCVGDIQATGKGQELCESDFRRPAGTGARLQRKGHAWKRIRGELNTEEELCQMETGRWQRGLSQAGLKSYQWRLKQVFPPTLHQLLVTPWLRSAKCWLGNKCPLAGRWDMRFHAKLWQSQRCPCRKKRLRGWEQCSLHAQFSNAWSTQQSHSPLTSDKLLKALLHLRGQNDF